MNEPVKTQAAAQPPADAAQATASAGTPSRKAVSDPREVAALVMARIHMVNGRKDELTIAIKSLTDVTQQLANAYSEQRHTLERLLHRVRALESAGKSANAPDAGGSSPPLQ